MSNCVYINEKRVPADEAALPINDLSIERGYAVFDFLKTVEGIPIFLDDHLQRLQRSAAYMHLNIPPPVVLTQRVRDIIRSNNLTESGIRITITGGISADGYSTTSPNIIIAPQSFAKPSAAVVANGLRLFTHKHQRQFPEIKTTDYLMAVWLKPRVAARGADDVLYYSEEGISESPRSNFFIVTDKGTLVTPHTGMLKGITRKKILACAAAMSIPFEERPVALSELKAAQGAFICSTTKGIIHLAAVDDVQYSSAPQMVDSLRAGLAQLVQDEVMSGKARSTG
jgi:D-alanine transaminase/branched-chain amino acid aminotransferase